MYDSLKDKQVDDDVAEMTCKCLTKTKHSFAKFSDIVQLDIKNDQFYYDIEVEYCSECGKIFNIDEH